ncbi:putative uncharacterized protein [Parasutterella excrementihominis CAG:233]|nr:putative uncharacterized protein [Parasutterella excrementihominis CAG:233]
MFMKRSGYNFLAGAGFSGQKDGCLALRQTSDSAEDFLHGRRLTDDFGSSLFSRSLFFFLTLFRCTPYEFNRFIDVERFGKIFERTALETCHGTVQIRIGRHDDDRKFWVGLLNFGEHFQAAFARHMNVTQNQGGLFFLDRLQHRLGFTKSFAGNICLLKCFF